MTIWFPPPVQTSCRKCNFSLSIHLPSIPLLRMEELGCFILRAVHPCYIREQKFANMESHKAALKSPRPALTAELSCA